MGSLKSIAPTRLLLWTVFMALLPAIALGTSISTRQQAIAYGLANCIESFAKKHSGRPPMDWIELNPYVDRERAEINIGATLESQVLLIGRSHPKLDAPDAATIVAITAFPIREDRRDAIGRYIVFQSGDGRFLSRWENEDRIQSALSKANTIVPQAEIYEERPLRALYPEYAMKLLDDAANHGISPEEAGRVVAEHVNDVASRRTSEATSWSQIAPKGLNADKQNQILAPPPNPTSEVAPFAGYGLALLAFVILATLGVLWYVMRKRR